MDGLWRTEFALCGIVGGSFMVQRGSVGALRVPVSSGGRVVCPV